MDLDLNLKIEQEEVLPVLIHDLCMYNHVPSLHNIQTSRLCINQPFPLERHATDCTKWSRQSPSGASKSQVQGSERWA